MGRPQAATRRFNVVTRPWRWVSLVETMSVSAADTTTTASDAASAYRSDAFHSVPGAGGTSEVQVARPNRAPAQ